MSPAPPTPETGRSRSLNAQQGDAGLWSLVFSWTVWQRCTDIISFSTDTPTAKIRPDPPHPREGQKLLLHCEGRGNPV